MTSPINMKIGKTVIIGGDGRQKAMAEYLNSCGVACVCCCAADTDIEQKINGAKCVIFPLPLTKDGINIYDTGEKGTAPIDSVLKLLKPEQKIFAGMVSAAAGERFASHGLTFTDYFKDEALTVYNAALTAEGLLKTVLDNTQRSLSRRVLITGYGRVAKAAARLFSACSAKVTVAVRNEKSRAQAVCDGFEAIFYSQLKSRIFIYDIIINTVPAQVIDKSLVRSVRHDALMLEAASAPYGIDRAAAEDYGKKLILCPGLPGRYKPVSAGRIIADTVIRLYGEEHTKW
ncbi:MAG: hypothetical protein MJ177_05505 [Clostridia bacterium]|nr:hypothetical protein [Clostridia bacterium]